MIILHPDLIRAVHGSIAVRCRGSGPPIVFCHGNSCSSRSFEKQLESGLADRFRLLAIDLPGHGDSLPARVPEQTYTLAGYAGAVVAAVSELEADNALFVGWSLGGHVLLEASHRLQRAAGYLIFGAPPIASFADFGRAAYEAPAIQAAFREASTAAEVHELLALFFRPGHPVPQTFFDDFRRTDPRARAAIGESAARGELRDELQVVRDLTVPLAVVHGAREALIRRTYIDTVSMPTLWRRTIQEVPDAGHAVQWENPDVFNDLVETFAVDCRGGR
jgi:pimeloyl-ACP methyl ester carboxylesterase